MVPSGRFATELAEGSDPYWQGMAHGSMRVLLFKPELRDVQEPHRQDEIYIVKSGAGTFFKSGDVRVFGPGDVIFVEAGAEHRFESFSADFETWVVFWGPDGGEGGPA
jgi:mannose-6-phosphate isomerase-like protein (cupin superfamily)